MLTKKQISELPKGFHTNTALNAAYPKHCAPQNSRGITKIVNLGTIEEPKMVSFMANRRQRKS